MLNIPEFDCTVVMDWIWGGKSLSVKGHDDYN